MDYVHYNSVKHGLVEKVADWPYSTFHRYVRQGVYEMNWAGVVNEQELEGFVMHEIQAMVRGTHYIAKETGEYFE